MQNQPTIDHLHRLIRVNKEAEAGLRAPTWPA
jgi:hypothetical protein